MARRRRGSGLLGLIAIVVIALLLVAYFQKHNIHLPGFGTSTPTTHKGSMAPMPVWPAPDLGSAVVVSL